MNDGPVRARHFRTGAEPRGWRRSAMIVSMVHKDQRISIIVKATRPESPGYRSIIFERPQNFYYEAGDWMDIAVKGTDLDGGKTYSFSSSPTERDLAITFRDGQSALKKALQGAVPGDSWFITQYGNDYGFHIRAHISSILIAGGVGVAPFRSMLKEMADRGDTHRVQLIYLNQTTDFLFAQELEQWAAELPNLRICYIATKELNRKRRDKTLLSLIPNTDHQFYIAGPPGMVSSTAELLKGVGVQDRQVKVDIFGGY